MAISPPKQASSQNQPSVLDVNIFPLENELEIDCDTEAELYG